MKTKILLGLAVVFLAMQAIRPARNESAVPSVPGKDEVTVVYPASPEVKQILDAVPGAGEVEFEA